MKEKNLHEGCIEQMRRLVKSLSHGSFEYLPLVLGHALHHGIGGAGPEVAIIHRVADPDVSQIPRVVANLQSVGPDVV